MTKYQVKGINDEVTICAQCGRSDLKKTVALEILDADGNGTGEIIRMGVDCAATAMRRKQSKIQGLAESAETARRRESEERERQAAIAQAVAAMTGGLTTAEALKRFGVHIVNDLIAQYRAEQIGAAA